MEASETLHFSTKRKGFNGAAAIEEMHKDRKIRGLVEDLVAARREANNHSAAHRELERLVQASREKTRQASPCRDCWSLAGLSLPENLWSTGSWLTDRWYQDYLKYSGDFLFAV